MAGVEGVGERADHGVHDHAVLHALAPAHGGQPVLAAAHRLRAEIAVAPYITVGTAKTHVARLLAKLGARVQVQLVITAYQAGLLDT